MSEQTPGTSAPASKKTLLIGVGVAAVAAVVILVVAVLPAEFGVDPTGLGGATGLSGLSGNSGPAVVESDALVTGAAPAPLTGPGMRAARQEFTLEGYSAVEHKFRLSEGQRMVFSWTSTEPVHFDMHAERAVGGEESYAQGDADAQAGTYTAQFDGIHGWYFQNRGLDPVTVTLDASGEFVSELIIDDMGETETPLAPAN